MSAFRVKSRDTTPLPAGLTLPDSLGRIMAFVPKWPLTILQLKDLVVSAITVDLTISDLSPFTFTRALSLLSVLFPWVIAVFISTALTETVCRQWVWYRLLQHRVVMDYSSSRLGVFVRVVTDPGVWLILCGCAVTIISKIMTHSDPMSVVGNFVALIMMYVFFVVEAETSQLPTINAFLKGDFDQNKQFLMKTDWVPESVVRRAALARRAEMLDFEKLARDAIVLKNIKEVESNVQLDRFWAMQLMGLIPLSAMMHGFSRVHLFHGAEDHHFGNMMRGWLLIFLVLPCLLAWTYDFFYFGCMFVLGYALVVASPCVVTFYLSKTASANKTRTATPVTASVALRTACGKQE